MKANMKKWLASALVLCMIFSLMPAAALAADTVFEVGDSLSLADAVAAANQAAGTETVTIKLPEGTVSPTANEQLRITRDNVVIEGGKTAS